MDHNYACVHLQSNRILTVHFAFFFFGISSISSSCLNDRVISLRETAKILNETWQRSLHSGARMGALHFFCQIGIQRTKISVFSVIALFFALTVLYQLIDDKIVPFYICCSKTKNLQRYTDSLSKTLKPHLFVRFSSTKTEDVSCYLNLFEKKPIVDVVCVLQSLRYDQYDFYFLLLFYCLFFFLTTALHSAIAKPFFCREVPIRLAVAIHMYIECTIDTIGIGCDCTYNLR